MTIARAPRGADQPLQAAGLIVLAMTVFGFADNLIRILSDEMSIWQFQMLRSLLVVPVLLAFALVARGATMRAKSWFWITLRSVLSVSGICLYFMAIPHLPIAQAAAGMFTSPLFVLLFSALFLREPVGPRRVIAVLSGFAGAIWILNPLSEELRWQALSPFAGGALYALSIIVTRARCRAESSLALTVSSFALFGLAGAIGLGLLTLWPASDAARAASPFIWLGWRPVSSELVLLLFAMAMTALIGVTSLARAYRIGESSFLAMFDYSYLIAASLFAFLIWDETPAPRIWLGAAMIVGAGLYLTAHRDVEPNRR